jgi:hypothetical protein
VNWEAISAIGQIVGALAVVISLIYLAKEVRSNARATVLSLLLSTAVSAEPVEHRPVSVRLEPVTYEESDVGVLLNFLDVKIARYHVVSDRPFGSLHVHVIFFERDMSGKLVETDRLETSCMFVQRGIRTATLSFLLSPTKAFVSLAQSPGDSKETRFLQKVKGEYSNWSQSPDSRNVGSRIEVYSVYSGAGGGQGDKLGSIELEVTAESP